MKLTAVRLREEARAWNGADLLGSPERRTWVVTLETDVGSAEGEIAWLPRVGSEPDVPSVVAVWAWAWVGHELAAAALDPALPPPVAWAITAALADLPPTWSPPASVPEAGLLAADTGTTDEVARRWSATMAAHPEIRVWKVKVGRLPLEQDLARLRALAVPEGVQLRLDPNQGWADHEPDAVADALADLPIAFVEQPAPWPTLARWAAALPCAADESVAEQSTQTLADAGIRALVLKPSVLGGLRAVLDRVLEARSLGLDVVLSSSLEGPVGRRHLRALATLCPPSAAGLARDALIEPPTAVQPAGDWTVASDPLERAATRFEDACAIETPEGSLAFSDWNTRAWEQAAWLGDRSGDRIPVEIDGPDGAIRLFAVLRAGAIACLVPPGVQQSGALAQVDASPWCAGSGTPPGIQVHRPATLLWSSGSQGTPRAIAHSLGQHLSSAAASHLHTPFAQGDRWLASLRMHHVGGLALLFRALHGGGTVVFPGDRPLASLRPTHCSWVPTQLLRAPDPPPPTLKHLLLGGAAAPPDLVRSRRALGWPVKTTYGSTELASQACTSTPTDDPLASGRPLAGREIRATPAIAVRGTTTCLGIWVDGTIRPLTDDEGWLLTGDVGSVDEDGALRVRGRADTMFISGGENVFPESIERVLGAHPAVRAVVVVDVPDPTWGARPWAFVDGALDLEGARALCSAHLPRHAWVDRVLPWRAEGVGSTGKPRRAWFRAAALALSEDQPR